MWSDYEWTPQVFEDICFWGKMFKNLFALALIAGTCYAYPHEDESTTVPQPDGPLDPERSHVYPEDYPEEPEKRPTPVLGAFNPEREPVDPAQGPYDSEKDPFTAQNAIFPTEIPEDIASSQDGSKPESDLKTDATFWWPFYRSWSWGYPRYRTYWSYPHYRYYRPRTYYR